MDMQMSGTSRVHTGIHCVVCGREKSRDNHWLRVHIEAGGLLLVPYGDPRAADGGPVCGGECANRVFGRWLAGFFEMRHGNPLPDKPSGETHGGAIYIDAGDVLASPSPVEAGNENARV
jgi:hypothetical protein